MVLSCIDLVSVLTIYPGILLYLVSWLREDYDFLRKMSIYPNFVYRFLGFSTFTLLVISIERYLGAYYPIFHHTLVTRRRLLILLAILLISTTAIYTISGNGVHIIRGSVFLMIILAIFPLSFMFVNFKLFIIARKVHRERAVLPEKRRTINLKNISTALWAVGCLMLLSIPCCFLIACIHTC